MKYSHLKLADETMSQKVKVLTHLVFLNSQLRLKKWQQQH